jgi:outer membrane lipoprotein-sorting protein
MRKFLCGPIALLFLVACAVHKERVNTENAPSETVVSSTPPFQTKEPDRYRATRTITITAAGKTVVTKTSIAKDAELRRYESTDDTDRRVVYLDVREGHFVLWPEEKSYADADRDDDGAVIEQEDTSPEALLHNESTSTTYQKIGPELVSGRNTTKYRVVVNNSTSGNVSVSETLIWIDDALHLPIRSETTSAGGSKVIMELSDLSVDVDKTVFQIPTDYKHISHREAQKLQK